jgi:hypothetical protein
MQDLEKFKAEWRYLQGESDLLTQKKTLLKTRSSLVGFVQHTTPNWKPSKVHHAICAAMDRVKYRATDRLLILCPPQHGKSEIVSRRSPAYFLGDMPREEIISVSASAPLAEDFGAAVRDCMRSQEYHQLYPWVKLAEDSRAKGRWRTEQGGSYYAVGIGGQLYGRGGMAIIDDPFGSWEDAQSARERDRVWDWYRGTLYNRIRPKKPIIIIQHRMHEEDLAGRLIEQMKAGGRDQWTVVQLKADLEDPPWPEVYDRAALERIRDNTDPRQWSALYLQDPTPEEGTFFKREWIKWYSKPPANLHKYCSSDFAVTDGGGDSTEIWTHGVDPNDDLYLGIEAYEGKTTADVWIEEMIGQFDRHKPFAHFGESGVIRRAIEALLVKRMRERRVFCRLEWITRTRDKPSMSRALQARMAMGKVWLPDNAHGKRLFSQLLSFPGGMHDDAVDQAALMALAIDEAHPGIAPPAKVVPIGDRYDRLFNQEPRSATWKTV